MFDDYQRLVLKTYRNQREKGELSHDLMHPTAARLRDEGVRRCEDELERKDEKILRDIFNNQPNVAAYRQAIKNSDPDRFRPLLALLQGRINKTNEKNVELLAWLMDFEPRPYEPGRDYTDEKKTEPAFVVGENGESDAVIDESEPTDTESEQNSAEKPKSKGIVFLFSLLGLLALGGITAYLASRKPVKPEPILTGIGQCMYWAGDHYQPVNCSQKLGDTVVYALDARKVSRFKRITRPDTLTANDAHKVWYSKISGQVEFYTDSGDNPLHPEIRLLPATAYMITKYAHNATANR
jgi:hypothetical protein